MRPAAWGSECTFSRCLRKTTLTRISAGPLRLSRAVLAFDITPEAVEDRLPALLLHFGRVLGLGIERDAEADAVGLLFEARHDFAAVAHAVFDQFLRHDARIGALEV